ncbi:hypothetical protein SAMN05421847_0381 [Halpernia humi]|uniref:Photosystem I assembly protein Ycf4 n=1 Tax=Halpernia humi TaxID=493375 RepID=A0A1H5T6B7_9FLAO|nr:hypothetical protein [Halpernia humi]SEF58373.1 hypothetical protein SAMN05421847_0381 [Halpernia humi]
MRLSNRNKAPLYNFFLTFLNLIVGLGVILFLLEIFRFNILGNEQYLLLIIPISLLVVFLLMGKQIFEYDSDGEALNLKNRSIIPFLRKVVNDEFPKYKVLKFEIVNFGLIKRLYLTISSKKSHSIILKYEISYLTKKEINDLKFSLNKVIKQNRLIEKSEQTQ